MKISAPNFSAALAAVFTAVTASVTFAQAIQTTATTDPVGFMTTTIPAGSLASPVNRVVSISLYKPADYAGACTARTSSTCQFASPGWTANQFVASPHFVRIRTGTQTGRFFLIT